MNSSTPFSWIPGHLQAITHTAFRSIAIALSVVALSHASAEEAAGPTELGEITVFTARKIITMVETMPEATAVAVADGRIVAVGSMDSLQGWLDGRDHTVVDTFADKVLMPGFIDTHVHPSLPAVLLHFPFLAPDDWDLPTGKYPGATTPDAYVARLKELVAQHEFTDRIPFIAWGYHPLWHGEQFRAQLTKLFPEKPVMLWHRSFHEIVANDAALEWSGLTEADVAGNHEVDWEKGHFWENGLTLIMNRLSPYLFDPDVYAKGMGNFFAALHRGGVTTALDMGVGIFGDPEGESALIAKSARELQPPSRVILTPTQFDFSTRKVSPAQALVQAEAWAEKYNGHRVMFDKHFKLQVDGAIFSGLSQFRYPGYLDGHQGMWMEPPEVFYRFAEPFWKAGYQIHAHINGDASADLFIDIIRRLQEVAPRTGHRATLEHYAYVTEDQVRQLDELGILVSANPYYHYILSDIYSDQYLGPDRGKYMVRLGSLEKAGIPFGLHSDCPMGPLSPLTLAWSAINRVSINGNLNGKEERVSLHTALRAITIDAAWILRREDDIGSISSGKVADFAVLEQDPYEVGGEGLRDIAIWGTVFEGKPYPLPKD